MGTPELIAFGAFLAIVVLVAGPYYIFVVRPEEDDRAALQERLKTGRSTLVRVSAASRLQKEVERLSTIGPLNWALSGDWPLAAGLRELIRQSNARIKAGQLVLGAACLVLLAFIL